MRTFLQRRFPIITYLLSLVAVIIIRCFLEGFTDNGPVGPLDTRTLAGPITLFGHYLFWCLAIFLLLIFVLHLITRLPIHRVSNFLMLGAFILMTAPLVDLIVSWGHGADIGYLDISYGSFFLSIGQFLVWPSLTTGLKIELSAIIIGAGIYTFIVTRTWWKALLGSGAFYFIIYLFFITPFLSDAINRLLAFPSYFLATLFSEYAFDLRVAVLYFAVFLLIFPIWLWKINPVKTKAALREIFKWPIAWPLVAGLAGTLIGYRAFHFEVVSFYPIISWGLFFFSIITLYGGMRSVSKINIAPPRLTPLALIQADYVKIAIGLGILGLLATALINLPLFLVNLSGLLILVVANYRRLILPIWQALLTIMLGFLGGLVVFFDPSQFQKTTLYLLIVPLLALIAMAIFLVLKRLNTRSGQNTDWQSSLPFWGVGLGCFVLSIFTWNLLNAWKNPPTSFDPGATFLFLLPSFLLLILLTSLLVRYFRQKKLSESIKLTLKTYALIVSLVTGAILLLALFGFTFNLKLPIDPAWYPLAVFALTTICLAVWLGLDRLKTYLVIKNARFQRGSIYFIMALLGIAVAIAYYGQDQSLVSEVFRIILVLLSIGASWGQAALVNDLTDTAIDKINNRERALVRGTLSRRDYIVGIAVLSALAIYSSWYVNYSFFVTILVYQITLTFLYSCPPFRFRRWPFISNFVTGCATLLCALGGYISHIPDENFHYFPASLILLILLLVTVVSSMKDLKDIDGDLQNNVYTIPNLLSKKISRVNVYRVIGLMAAISFCLVPLILHKYFNWPMAIFTGLFAFLIYWLIGEVRTKDKYYLMTTYGFIIVIAILVFAQGVHL